MLVVELLLLIPFIKKYKSLEKLSKFVFYYLIASIIFAGGSIICKYLNQNNMWLFSIMHYLQFLFISLFYIEVIKSSLIKTIIKVVFIALLMIVLADFFLIEGRYFFNSIAVTARNIIILIYGLVFFLQLVKDEDLVQEEIYINSLPSFWFNSGIFIYTCSSFMLCLSVNYIQNATPSEQENFLIVLGFSYIAGIVQLLLFYFGLKQTKKYGK